MKNLHYIVLTAAVLLAPTFVFAEETGATVDTETSATVNTKPEKPLPPGARKPLLAPGQIIKTIKETASTTRETVKGRIDAAQNTFDKRKAEIKTLLDKKPRGIMSSTTIAAREEKREEMRAKLEAKKEEVKNRIEAAREKAKEKFGEAVQKSVGNIADRLTKAVEHLASIAERIDNRIKEYEVKGKDMSVSIGLLATARTDITTAQDKIAAVGVALSAALASATPKDEMPKVRSAVKAAEDALKQARESLHKVLESVRAESEVSAEAAADTN